MTILVFGKTGQVACELKALGNVTCLSRDEADLSDPESCAEAIRKHSPNGVINAAAYTVVDRAEEEVTLATRVNGWAPAAMAKACAEMDVPFIHISTDYVFDGSGNEPWKPSELTNPKNAYGLSKLIGEKAVQEAGGRYAILRTSWVFSSHGSNFVKSMLKLSEDRDQLNIVADQVGGPTPAADIAQTCLDLVDQLANDASKSGTYHFSGAPDVSWKDFAETIFAQAGREVTVKGIATSEYSTPATRPLNSRLDCSSFEQTFGIARPDWRHGLKNVLKDLEITQ
ncbi:dTDP-4-dehydrorhamnose reductase [Erythrobacter vulgaris]|uniref:dTDP-4-dehydrorhamnose reductase n=1 Tax=Qipengyuania vulgaris TaxID=291985 RepID=A0A844XMT8_9SPHN|nr:dTDP-4-dehydrorhamnose reductase [Qipengyuania vulgaris]